jgi:hypothetical protein
VPDPELNRLVFETVEHDFVVEQVNSYVAAGEQVFHPMPPLPVALRLSGAMRSETGLKLRFADPNFPAKSVAAPDPVDIYVLRP